MKRKLLYDLLKIIVEGTFDISEYPTFIRKIFAIIFPLWFLIIAIRICHDILFIVLCILPFTFIVTIIDFILYLYWVGWKNDKKSWNSWMTTIP